MYYTNSLFESLSEAMSVRDQVQDMLPSADASVRILVDDNGKELQGWFQVMVAVESTPDLLRVSDLFAKYNRRNEVVDAAARMLVAPGIFRSMTAEQRRRVFSSDAGEMGGSDDEI